MTILLLVLYLSGCVVAWGMGCEYGGTDAATTPREEMAERRQMGATIATLALLSWAMCGSYALVAYFTARPIGFRWTVRPSSMHGRR